MTAEETARFQKSLESTEFRNLFFDYMNELSDPAKRALYEKELTMLEQERGVEATWIHPAPEYCLKIATTPKVFVNVCSSDLIDRPASSKQPGGTSWSIPYSLSKFRDDVDHENVACKVYDCVFHPETIQKAFANQAFKRLVSTTAIEGIEKQFEIVLGKDFKELKMKAKGVPQATMIKKADPNFVKKNQTGSEFIQKIIPLQKKMDSVERGPLVKTPAVKKAPLAKAVHIKPPAVQTPTYTIVHQTSYSDYQRFTSNRERQHGQRPDAIVVRIDLPELVYPAIT